MVFRSRLRNFKNIANSPDGLDHFLLEILIQLVSQSEDQDINHIGLGIKAVLPDIFHNQRLGNNFPGIAHKAAEEGELTGLQIDLLPPPGQPPD